MQLFLENFFASGLSILETEIIERQQLEEELQKVQVELNQKEMLLEQTQQERQCTQDYLIQRAEMYRSEGIDSCKWMFAGFNYEINSPVNFIAGNLKYAKQYTEDLLHIINLYAKHYPQPVAEIQSAIKDLDFDFLIEDLPKICLSMQIGVDHIFELLIKLRNDSRLLGVKMDAVNLHERIDYKLLMLNSRLTISSQNPSIQVIKEYGELPLVECYAELLNEVFIYLLSNAIDALEERVSREKQQEMSNPSETSTHYSPTITIRTGVSVDSSHVIIQIADNGPGMTEEIRLRLFDPSPMTQPRPSNGLFLFISHQIVEEKHGGQLRCVSELGKGTEFTIELPIRQQQQQPS